MKRNLTTVILFSVAAMMFPACKEPMLDRGEVEFKTLDTYRLDDFKLAKNVYYFEIVRNGSTSVVVARYGNKSEHTFGKKQPGKRSQLKLWQRLHGSSYGIMIPPIYTVRYIDADGHEGIIIKPEKLRSFLGEIDTPAELHLWLSLTGAEPPGYSYKKEKGMYRVRWNFSVINDTGMCVNYDYKYMVDSQGRMIKLRDQDKQKLCSESQRKKSLVR